MPEERSELIVAGQDGILAGFFRVGDDYETDRPQGRNDWLVLYTLQGRGYVWTPEGKMPCRAGDLALLKEGVPHRYGTERGFRWHFYWAHFPAADVGPSLLPETASAVRNIAEKRLQSRIHRAFRRILQDAREQEMYWYDLCIGALKEILALTKRGTAGGLDPRIADVLRLISLRSRETWQVETLAKAVGLSPSRLQHLFKAETGRTIIETLNTARVREAALMLEHTRLGTSEIAYAVGFQNYNHFLKQFRKRFGASPSEYRRRIANRK